MNRRVITIGDIDGCLEEFDELLCLVEYRQGTNRLVLAGDLVDRGPDSAGVVSRAMEIGAETVLGNREFELFSVAAKDKWAELYNEKADE